MSVAIVTDTTAYLPSSVVAERGLRVVPLHVVIAGREFSEGVDVTTAEGWPPRCARVPAGEHVPAAPSAFLQAYEDAAAPGQRDRVDPPLGGHVEHGGVRPAGGRSRHRSP